jgi:hypothetical protein
VNRQVILGGSAHGKSYLWDPTPLFGENIGIHTVFIPQGNRDQTLLPNDGFWGLHKDPVMTIKTEEPQVILTIEKDKVSLLNDTGASISAISFSFRHRSFNKITVQSISGQPLEHYFTQSLACFWGDFHFCHSFLIVPETPTPLL